MPDWLLWTSGLGLFTIGGMRVCEIFRTLQGETSAAGRPAVFIRLTGCNLRCRWCDTAYAWEEGHEAGRAEIVDRALGLGSGLIVLTGGEPLVQPETPALAADLAAAGREVLVETNGSLPIEPLAAPVRRIVDLKPPSSGMAGRLRQANLAAMRPGDELKCVVADRNDFEYCFNLLRESSLLGRFEVLFSPAAGLLEPARLADWVLACQAPVRLQLQLHRLLWPDRERGV